MKDGVGAPSFVGGTAPDNVKSFRQIKFQSGWILLVYIDFNGAMLFRKFYKSRADALSEAVTVDKQHFDGFAAQANEAKGNHVFESGIEVYMREIGRNKGIADFGNVTFGEKMVGGTH